MGDLKSVIAEVEAEIARAVVKFPTWPTRIIDAGNVVSEEAGELAKACLQVTYEPHKETLAGVRMEAVQTAAMAIRFLLSMARYDCTPGPQHGQFTGYEPCYCDQCGAVKGEARSTHCAPPYDVKPHAWTGTHPADVRAIALLNGSPLPAPPAKTEEVGS